MNITGCAGIIHVIVGNIKKYFLYVFTEDRRRNEATKKTIIKL